MKLTAVNVKQSATSALEARREGRALNGRDGQSTSASIAISHAVAQSAYRRQRLSIAHLWRHSAIEQPAGGGRRRPKQSRRRASMRQPRCPSALMNMLRGGRKIVSVKQSRINRRRSVEISSICSEHAEIESFASTSRQAAEWP